ncbi:MAG TPA: SRPBCC family protein [Longimicrobium sp.]|nr:SRPBCC family protein [Longimicrobium sp.]
MSELDASPAVETGMLIRRPAAEVFEAFIDPDITTKFWFTRSSGTLVAGQQVQWEGEMYGVSIPVDVKVVEPHRRIVVEWPGEGGPGIVEWLFTPMDEDSTFVGIANTGFTGGGAELAKQTADAAEGFSLVLAGLKALLEHGVRLNLVADRFPKGLDEK